MTEPQIHDNFFANPDAVREFALRQPYWDCSYKSITSGHWPGRRTLFVHWINATIFDEFIARLRERLALPDSATIYVESFFQSCNRHDGNSWVHQDVFDLDKTHVGVIYLNPDPPPNSGTLIYDPIPGADQQPDYDKSLPENYTVRMAMENRYNRMVCYAPEHFHKSDEYFGESVEDGRLFMVFFMRVEGA